MDVMVHLADGDARRLHEMAIKCGYEGVGQLLSEYALTLSDETAAPYFDSLSEQELLASARSCDVAREQIKQGKGIPAREAIDGIARELGLPRVAE